MSVDAAGINKLMRLFTAAQAKNDRSLAAVDSLLTWAEEAGGKVEEEFGAFVSEVGALQSAVEGEAGNASTALGQLTTAAQGAAGNVGQATGTVGSAADSATASVEKSTEAVNERSGAIETRFAAAGGALDANESSVQSDGESVGGALDGLSEKVGATSEQLDGALGDAAETFGTQGDAIEGEVAGALREGGEKTTSEFESQAGSCEGRVGDLETGLNGTYESWNGEAEGAKSGLLEGISSAAGNVVQNLIETADASLREPCDRLQYEVMAPTQENLGRVIEAAESWGEQTADFSGSTDDIDRGYQAKQRLDAVGD